MVVGYIRPIAGLNFPHETPKYAKKDRNPHFSDCNIGFRIDLFKSGEVVVEEQLALNGVTPTMKLFATIWLGLFGYLVVSALIL